MTQFEVKPTIQICDTCAELAQALELGPKDLILTNQYIYDPYFGPLNLSCPTIFQEKYGAGEPSDEMVTAIYNDMPKDVTPTSFRARGWRSSPSPPPAAPAARSPTSPFWLSSP